MSRRIAVRAIVLHEGKLLAARLRPSEAAPANGSFWCVPGGGLESGEDLLSGLERELIEETGVRPQIGNLLYVQQYKDEKGEYLEFIFGVTNSKDFLHIDLAQTSHGLAELEGIAFIDPSTVNLLPKFLTDRPLMDDMQAGTTHYFNYL